MNPLTARVMVNRIWQHHFGEGIVRTPSNFGKMGERPSHPELLDWLAVEFVEHGWSIKHMHRLMMLSETYQMSSNDIASNVAIDPENRMFWRMPRQRLEAEIIRDAIWSVSGKLDRSLGGPAIYPYIDPEAIPRPARSGPGRANRMMIRQRGDAACMCIPNAASGIHVRNFRSAEPDQLGRSAQPFDRRTASVADDEQQSSSCSRSFRRTYQGEAGEDVRAQVERAYRLALGASPQSIRADKSDGIILQDNPKGLAEFCQALFNLNEFVYGQ